jgi:hypothetical protein
MGTIFTPDDGYISLYSLSNKIPKYDLIYDKLSSFVYGCNGYSVNKRRSGLFTLEKEKVGAPLCNEWQFVPDRYIYQPFHELLIDLRKHVLQLNVVPAHETLTDAIVNFYEAGDFIAFHKDYHSERATLPVACILSFEKNKDAQHSLEFYRTTGDKDAPARKERGKNAHAFKVTLPDRSIAVMVGMQKRYVHAVEPGPARISIVFTTR